MIRMSVDSAEKVQFFSSYDNSKSTCRNPTSILQQPYIRILKISSSLVPPTDEKTRMKHCHIQTRMTGSVFYNIYSHGHSDLVLFLIGRITIPSPITSASWCKSVSVALVLDMSFIPPMKGGIPGQNS
ncbi:hypothetical protein Y032_0373g181 [Ancylostoma ceylanicum]|uniref:Uncharacterized protein n=1 Tax=Ancylostoma ceylanicum TaxID=53326 RepID=A0A016RTW5_9BILA|nr:hypothetical protein Y032_0373g181 [Ancylostoma ceylanicum]